MAEWSIKSPGEQKADWEVELISCASDGDYDRCAQLLALGAGVDATDTSEMTPLHWACMHGHDDIVELLIEAGADPARTDEIGNNALAWAACNDNVDSCVRLLALGVPATSQNSGGSTPLHSAIVNRNADLISLLLSNGATSSFVPENPPADYLTPFQTAVKGKRLPIVRFFHEECGEDLRQLTVAGKTLLQLAGRSRVAEYLRAHLASLAVQDAIGENTAVTAPSSRARSFNPL